MAGFFAALHAEALVSGALKLIEKAFQGAAENGGKAFGKQIENFLTPLDRPTMWAIIGSLAEFDDPTKGVGITEAEFNTARQNLIRRHREATVAGKEYRFVEALIRLLCLDPINEKGEYTKGHDNARIEYIKLGLLSDAEFDQAIDFLMDEPVKEWFTHNVLKKYEKYKVEIVLVLTDLKSKGYKYGQDLLDFGQEVWGKKIPNLRKDIGTKAAAGQLDADARLAAAKAKLAKLRK